MPLELGKAFYALGIVVLIAWIGFSTWVAILSPLYTVGGADAGWWLVCFHWGGTILAGVALAVTLKLRKTGRQTALAIAWLTAPLSYIAWLGFYEFFNAVLSPGGGSVGLPI